MTLLPSFLLFFFAFPAHHVQGSSTGAVPFLSSPPPSPLPSPLPLSSPSSPSPSREIHPLSLPLHVLPSDKAPKKGQPAGRVPDPETHYYLFNEKDECFSLDRINRLVVAQKECTPFQMVKVSFVKRYMIRTVVPLGLPKHAKNSFMNQEGCFTQSTDDFAFPYTIDTYEEEKETFHLSMDGFHGDMIPAYFRPAARDYHPTVKTLKAWNKEDIRSEASASEVQSLFDGLSLNVSPSDTAPENDGAAGLPDPDTHYYFFNEKGDCMFVNAFLQLVVASIRCTEFQIDVREKKLYIKANEPSAIVQGFLFMNHEGMFMASKENGFACSIDQHDPQKDEYKLSMHGFHGNLQIAYLRPVTLEHHHPINRNERASVIPTKQRKEKSIFKEGLGMLKRHLKRKYNLGSNKVKKY